MMVLILMLKLNKRFKIPRETNLFYEYHQCCYNDCSHDLMAQDHCYQKDFFITDISHMKKDEYSVPVDRYCLQ